MWHRTIGTTTNRIAVVYQNPFASIVLLRINKLDSDWIIHFRPSCDDTQNTIRELLDEAGLGGSALQYNAHDKTFVLRSDTTAPIIYLINLISLFMQNFSEIKEEISSLLEVDFAQHISNFNWIRASNHPGSTSLKYFSRYQDFAVTEIGINPAGSVWKVEIKTPTLRQKELINATLRAANFPLELIDFLSESDCTLRLTSTDFQMIATFVHILKEHARHFEEIEAEICQQLGIDLNQALNADELARIYPETGGGEVPVGEDDDSFLDILRRVTTNDFTLENRIEEIIVPRELRFENEARQGMIVGVNALAEATQETQGPRGRNIVLEHAYGSPLSQANHRTNRQRFFNHQPGFGFTVSDDRDYFVHSSPRIFATPAPELASLSNAEKIKGFVEDDVIPKDYICPLTLSIMTDPVSLRNDVTKAKFERSAIARWLSEQSIRNPSRTGPHPLNPSARFTINDLVPELALKNEIDSFVVGQNSLNALMSILRTRGYSTRLELHERFSFIQNEEHFLLIKKLLSDLGIHVFEQEPTEDELALLESQDDVDGDIEEQVASLLSADDYLSSRHTRFY
ncbi:MAG: RNA polymerase sigma factor region1.1 domain-containing protein [Legionellaceae bacterium]|nr:RNA polymerase sigma factor region1.1 domain-containing protein [Legionellaceae bacterium]